MTEHLVWISTATLAVTLFVAGISTKNLADVAGLKVKVKDLCSKINE